MGGKLKPGLFPTLLRDCLRLVSPYVVVEAALELLEETEYVTLSGTLALRRVSAAERRDSSVVALCATPSE